MDMDPMTRREADKVERILVDLVEELKLLSFLPEEFSSWVRDETVVAAIGSESNHFLQLYEAHAARKEEEETAERERKTARAAAAGSGQEWAGDRSRRTHARGSAAASIHIPSGVTDKALAHSAATSSSSSDDLSADWAELEKDGGGSGSTVNSLNASAMALEDEEERQRAIKAGCFVHTAAQYGDPTDYEDNEAVAQVSEFAQLERGLLDSATTTGYTDPNDIQMHHLTARAVVDTLREGGYGAAVQYFLKRLYRTPRAAQGVKGAKVGAPATDTVQMHVYGCGMVEESVDHLRELVETLYRLIHERNRSTVNEDIHRYQLLHDAVNKDQAGTADVQVLNQRFLDVKAARKREVAELDNEIQQLEGELQYVRQAADVELEALQRVQETIQNDHRCTLRQQLEAHRTAAETVARNLLQAQAKNLDELNVLRSQRTKREAAVSGAIADYDAQTAQLEAAVRQFNHEAEEDTERIVRLEAEVQSLQKQKDEFAWELKVAEQRQEHASVIRQRQEQDARVIQAYYRAFRARQLAQQALEKGSKKSKKKGGAKKK
ncbi:hypothetical protein ABB37_06790 [Leptomonas pyrrhocoris]|uniref:Dynein regulatory complex protein 10 n=1 Tax=Leptomonas pyrrhocoris TaxID=157538 RepID=A0A0M9FXN2_LEPPY|nr:hypothetical protein ABB37_06790 [Leptomonas pyrrhocoris]XP_015656488.1 hypothetical protein ABB37_06790 [Leptomonas pyrrhocoris]KPA78048.1 hypothetical protein ABB37_06790 [Leptomonas pyrrhocoris]KPA78049.1 hypothetical protein ABB37_06790 [Leptomonas pyrrhocoris]|eukprot:XP_015656487.1 hypothetical protein ABB37_06790 [Leptomonas pyrrhocoris]